MIKGDIADQPNAFGQNELFDLAMIRKCPFPDGGEAVWDGHGFRIAAVFHKNVGICFKFLGRVHARRTVIAGGQAFKLLKRGKKVSVE